MFNWCYIFFGIDEKVNINENENKNKIITEQPRMQIIDIIKKID